MFSSLRKELTVILVIKLLLMWTLWYVFFSHKLKADKRAKGVASIYFRDSASGNNTSINSASENDLSKTTSSTMRNEQN